MELAQSVKFLWHKHEAFNANPSKRVKSCIHWHRLPISALERQTGGSLELADQPALSSGPIKRLCLKKQNGQFMGSNIRVDLWPLYTDAYVYTHTCPCSYVNTHTEVQLVVWSTEP